MRMGIHKFQIHARELECTESTLKVNEMTHYSSTIIYQTIVVRGSSCAYNYIYIHSTDVLVTGTSDLKQICCNLYKLYVCAHILLKFSAHYHTNYKLPGS